ncbi:hypothetical protein FA15DRAFT_658219 [Coprinopsis marcescibilis]|uniref:Uncharacterized protein n=1 Tax=Coprinopsis marcescibilis TaxID=230819 RepID=A0A5C3KZZ6_COPMA|nr:hypothetical protein FA15DRAFT_658219 [Coprinopsis marcescibilis]
MKPTPDLNWRPYEFQQPRVRPLQSPRPSPSTQTRKGAPRKVMQRVWMDPSCSQRQRPRCRREAVALHKGMHHISISRVIHVHNDNDPLYLSCEPNNPGTRMQSNASAGAGSRPVERMYHVTHGHTKFSTLVKIKLELARSTKCSQKRVKGSLRTSGDSTGPMIALVELTQAQAVDGFPSSLPSLVPVPLAIVLLDSTAVRGGTQQETGAPVRAYQKVAGRWIMEKESESRGRRVQEAPCHRGHRTQGQGYHADRVLQKDLLMRIRSIE